MKNKIDVSVILTGYNEGPDLYKNLCRVKRVLEDTKYKWEIILIDDKSQDDTPLIFQKFATCNKNNISVYLHKKNIGRGGTIIEGIQKAKGSIVGFLDTDLELSPHNIPEFIRAIQDGADIAAGVRFYGILGQTIIRTIASRGYIWLVKRYLQVDLEDTSAGFKFFKRRKILSLLKKIKDRRWFFDTEIMVRGHKAGYRIAQIPIIFSWKPNKKSSVNVISDSIYFLIKLYDFKRTFLKKKD